MSISKVIRLDVEENELIERLLNRGKLEGRADDNRETIESRLKVYQNQTQPLIEFYNKQNKMSVIEGSGDINDIFASIVEVMDKHLEK